jgi:hypothetical protein
MISIDVTKCHTCQFPAIYHEIINYTNRENKCPMCENVINPQLLEKLDDPITYLKSRKVASLDMFQKEINKDI